MKTLWTGMMLLGLLAAAAGVQAEEKPRLAVLMMDSYGSGLTADEVVGLTDLLAAEMTKGERYSVMPRDELRKRLVERKSKKPLGPPPDKALESGIYRVGKQCFVLARIYDAPTAVMETAALERGPCTADALMKEVKAAAGNLVRAEADLAAPLSAVFLFESRASGLKADEVVALTRMVESDLVSEGVARLAPTDGMRNRLAKLTGKALPPLDGVRYGVSGQLVRMTRRGSLCLSTLRLNDLRQRSMIVAVPGRSACDPDSLVKTALSMSQDLVKEMRKLKGSAKGTKEAPSAPASPIKLPPRPASPASGR